MIIHMYVLLLFIPEGVIEASQILCVNPLAAFMMFMEERKRSLGWYDDTRVKGVSMEIIIINSPSTAGHRPVQLHPISLIFGCANRHSTWPEFHTTFTETRSPLQNSFTPAVVGSTADMASPLPLQRANTVCYVGDFSFLPNQLVSDSRMEMIRDKIRY
jgi:hypothetical protein